MTTGWWIGATNRAVRQTPLAYAACPSATNPKANWWYGDDGSYKLGDGGEYTLHYQGVAGAAGRKASRPFIRRRSTTTSNPNIGGGGVKSKNGVLQISTLVSVGDVSDGTSNTLMIGEISWHKGEYEPWLGGYSGGGMNMMSCKNIMYPFRSRFYNPGQKFDPGYPAATDICNTSFGAMHPGGCNFARADGSVQFYADEISLDVLKSLATRNGGEVFDQNRVAARRPAAWQGRAAGHAVAGTRLAKRPANGKGGRRHVQKRCLRVGRRGGDAGVPRLRQERSGHRHGQRDGGLPGQAVDEGSIQFVPRARPGRQRSDRIRRNLHGLDPRWRRRGRRTEPDHDHGDPGGKSHSRRTIQVGRVARPGAIRLRRAPPDSTARSKRARTTSRSNSPRTAAAASPGWNRPHWSITALQLARKGKPNENQTRRRSRGRDVDVRMGRGRRRRPRRSAQLVFRSTVETASPSRATSASSTAN